MFGGKSSNLQQMLSDFFTQRIEEEEGGSKLPIDIELRCLSNLVSLGDSLFDH